MNNISEKMFVTEKTNETILAKMLDQNSAGNIHHQGHHNIGLFNSNIIQTFHNTVKKTGKEINYYN